MNAISRNYVNNYHSSGEESNAGFCYLSSEEEEEDEQDDWISDSDEQDWISLHDGNDDDEYSHGPCGGGDHCDAKGIIHSSSSSSASSSCSSSDSCHVMPQGDKRVQDKGLEHENLWSSVVPAVVTARSFVWCKTGRNDKSNHTIKATTTAATIPQQSPNSEAAPLLNERQDSCLSETPPTLRQLDEDEVSSVESTSRPTLFVVFVVMMSAIASNVWFVVSLALSYMATKYTTRGGSSLSPTSTGCETDTTRPEEATKSTTAASSVNETNEGKPSTNLHSEGEHDASKSEEEHSESNDDDKSTSNDSATTTTAAAASSTNQQQQQRRRYVWYAFVLWCLELLFLVTVRRTGMMEKELNQVVETLELQWSRLNESSPLSYLTMEKKRKGYQLHEAGARKHFPVVMVPGFVTSGLEVWGGQECARKHFRQRLWAALGGARSFLMERDCWRQHMMLDVWTGSDPDDGGIRLRAAQGFEAADYFLGNYWVFGKLIENLADLGYTSSEMTMEAYDWRLAFPLLEQRDGYLTRLKLRIEGMHHTLGKKVVLTSHSMGAQLVHYFFAWVTTPVQQGGGGGGKDWVDRHIHAYVNIAGAHLGVPKAATALLSGEMSDTVILGTVGNMVEQFFGRRPRRDLWTTWGSLWAMLPNGGNAIWGIGADMCPAAAAAAAAGDEELQQDAAVDDPLCPSDETRFMPMIAMTDTWKAPPSLAPVNAKNNNNNKASDVETCEAPPQTPPPPPPHDGKLDLTMLLGAEGLAALDYDVNDTPVDLAKTPSPIQHVVEELVSRESHTTEQLVDFLKQYGAGEGAHVFNAKAFSQYGNVKDARKSWHDPSRTPLPYAPNMKVYCLYGVGVPTERAYYYKVNVDEGTSPDPTNSATGQGHVNGFMDPPVILDANYEEPTKNPNIKYGVRYSDGDGSVPLLSLGYICADAWQRPETGLNPARTVVTVREYQHRTEFTVDDPMRGGPYSADHVDVLGNVDMTEDFLRIVSNFEVDQVNESRILSKIQTIAAEINQHPQGGILYHGKKKQQGRRRRHLPWFQHKQRHELKKKNPVHRRAQN